MPIPVVCHECGCGLKAPDRLAGRKAKCPRCQAILTIKAAAPTKVSPALKERTVAKQRKTETEQRITRKPKERGEDETAPKERTVAKQRKTETEERITRKPKARDEDGPEDKAVAVKASKKPKGKKRKRPQKQSDQFMPTWALWLVSVGGFAVVAGSLALGAIYKGYGPLVLIFSVIMAVMLPLSMIILILSMYISSWLGGGIEFGEVHVVIPKSLGLLFVVNLIGLLPMGRYLAAPIWLFGLKLLFGLDLWEARILVFVNWCLNFLVNMAVFSIIFAAFAHGVAGLDALDKLEQHPLTEEEKGMKAIMDLNGDFTTADAEDDDGPVVSVTLVGTRASDADLGKLKSFSKLRTLDLSGTAITDDGLAHLEALTTLRSLKLARTAITDAGLVHLKKLTQLETLSLTGTNVTEAGAADLQTALPRMRIVP